MPVFCHRCGSGLPASARFCSNCGTVVTSAPPPSSRPLVRPHMGRAIAGVCVGLAQAYNWDVAIVRVVAVIGLCFSGGMVGIAYLACWIGIPEQPINIPGTYPPNV